LQALTGLSANALTCGISLSRVNVSRTILESANTGIGKGEVLAVGQSRVLICSTFQVSAWEVELLLAPQEYDSPSRNSARCAIVRVMATVRSLKT
jgi:hypothetical protein